MAECLYYGDKPIGLIQSNAEDVEYSTGVSVKDKIDELSAIKIRAGIETGLNFTANTQLEITVNISNSPFSTNDYAINVAFEYFAGADNSIKYLIRNASATSFVIRAISPINMTGAKMHWTAIKSS